MKIARNNNIPDTLVTKYAEIIVPTNDARHYRLRSDLLSQKGFRTNSLGLRSVEIPEPQSHKKSMTILFLGDSVVMGSKIEKNEEIFTEHFRMIAEQKLHYTVTVLNGGCSCYNTQQMYAQLDAVTRSVMPQVVFLHCTVNEVTLGAQLGTQWSEGLSWCELFGHTATGEPAQRPVLRQVNPVPPIAFQVLRKYLLLCIQLCQQVGAVPVLVTAPRLLHSQYTNKYLNDMTACGHDVKVNVNKERYLGRGIDTSNNVVKDIAHRLGVVLVDLAAFVDSLPHKEQFFLDYFHFNEVGHQVVARCLVACSSNQLNANLTHSSPLT